MSPSPRTPSARKALPTQATLSRVALSRMALSRVALSRIAHAPLLLGLAALPIWMSCPSPSGTSGPRTSAGTTGATDVSVADPLLAPCPAPSLRSPVKWFYVVARRIAAVRDRLETAARAVRGRRDPMRYACLAGKARAAALVAGRAADLGPGLVRVPRDSAAPAGLLALCQEARRLWSEARRCPGGAPALERSVPLPRRRGRDHPLGGTP